MEMYPYNGNFKLLYPTKTDKDNEISHHGEYAVGSVPFSDLCFTITFWIKWEESNSGKVLVLELKNTNKMILQMEVENNSVFFRNACQV